MPPPTADGGKSPKELSEMVERYLAGHFAGYGRELPPRRALRPRPAARRASAADGSAGGHPRQPDPRRSTASASTATRCARRSATSTSRCSARRRRERLVAGRSISGRSSTSPAPIAAGARTSGGHHAPPVAIGIAPLHLPTQVLWWRAPVLHASSGSLRTATSGAEQAQPQP